MNDRLIKFKIDLLSKSSSMEAISCINEQIVLFIDSLSDLIQDFEISTTIINQEDMTNKNKYNKKSNKHSYVDNVDYDKEIKISEKDYNDSVDKTKDMFYSGTEFDKYFNSFSTYRKQSESKSINYIKDFLTKNRSAKLTDIINACEEQGDTSKSENRSPAFYWRLKKLTESGKVTKQDKVYIWNYKED